MFNMYIVVVVMADTDEKPKKVPMGTNVDPAVAEIITDLAAKDDRPISNMIERLLKESPKVEELLRAGEPVGA